MTSHKKDSESDHKGHGHAKQNSGSEPSKHAQKLHADADRDEQEVIDAAEAHDHKKGNIGPSGQGSHRGRERDNFQSNASGRPNVSSADTVHH